MFFKPVTLMAAFNLASNMAAELAFQFSSGDNKMDAFAKDKIVRLRYFIKLASYTCIVAVRITSYVLVYQVHRF